MKGSTAVVQCITGNRKVLAQNLECAYTVTKASGIIFFIDYVA